MQRSDHAARLPAALTPVLTYAEAEALTEQIRTAATDTADRMDDLVALVTQARNGHADQVMGFASWPAYLGSVAGTVHAGRDNRKAIAQYLADQGLSVRAAARILGVHERTVRRDLELVPGAADAAPDSPPPTTGLDGKTYPKRKRQQVTTPKPRRAPIQDQTKLIRGRMYELARSLERLRADDRYTPDLGRSELLDGVREIDTAVAALGVR